MPIMKREAEDDFQAWQTANAMEKAGAVVISITPNGMRQHFNAREPHQRYIVWARVESDGHIGAVDEAINHEIDG